MTFKYIKNMITFYNLFILYDNFYYNVLFSFNTNILYCSFLNYIHYKSYYNIYFIIQYKTRYNKRKFVKILQLFGSFSLFFLIFLSNLKI